MYKSDAPRMRNASGRVSQVCVAWGVYICVVNQVFQVCIVPPGVE